MRMLTALLLAFSLIIVPPSASDADEKAGQRLRNRLRGFLVGAHRGGMASFGLLENSLRQFRRALRSGVDIIEMDLQLSKDNVVIVAHDTSLEAKTFNCRGQIPDKALAEIKQCILKISRQPHATFEEVLQWARGRVVLNAELKMDQVIEPAIALARKYDAYDWVYFATGQFRRRYRRARAFDPHVPLLFVPNEEDSLHWALGLQDENLIIIEVQENIRKPHLIEEIHRSGKLVTENSWHFAPFWNRYENFLASCTAVYRWKIDIAITNRPKSCVRQRDAFVKRHGGN